MSDHDKKNSPDPGNFDKIEVDELDDKSLENAAGGNFVANEDTKEGSGQPNGVQCYC